MSEEIELEKKLKISEKIGKYDQSTLYFDSQLKENVTLFGKEKILLSIFCD